MKYIQKNSQSGRSMVEMLGVLAVIGVLSVGGITGYKYAMDIIYKNKALEIVQHFILSVKIENEKDISLYDTTETLPTQSNKETTLYFYENYLGKNNPKWENTTLLDSPVAFAIWRTHESRPAQICLTFAGPKSKKNIFPKSQIRPFFETIFKNYSDELYPYETKTILSTDWACAKDINCLETKYPNSTYIGFCVKWNPLEE